MLGEHLGQKSSGQDKTLSDVLHAYNIDVSVDINSDVYTYCKHKTKNCKTLNDLMVFTIVL